MANTPQQIQIQKFLKACEENTDVPPPGQQMKTRDMVNKPKMHKELKRRFQMEEDDVLYKAFWDDFFSLAPHIGEKDTQIAETTIYCCCSCCL